VPEIVLVGELSERFGHVQEPGLVVGFGDLLRQPHAFRGISTVIDSVKKRQPNPPRHAAVEVASGSIGSPQFHITKLLKNKVPKIGVALTGTVEAGLRESEKFRNYAAECIRIASQMSGKDRQALLEIADAWETRARDTEKKENDPRS
jgi:hypothetical protein